MLDVHNGWVDGFRRAGCYVADHNLDDRANFYSQALFRKDGEIVQAVADADDAVKMAVKSVWEPCYELWPDIVLVTSGFWIPPAMLELMRLRGHKVVLVFTESPYEDDKQLKLAPYADLVLINDPTNLDEFRAVNPNTMFQPHLWREDVHTPGPPVDRWRSDVCMVGTGYPSRMELLEQADLDGLDVLLAGNWPAEVTPHGCVDNVETVDIYRSSKVGLNLYRKEHTYTADGWAAGPREIEMAAVGLPFVRESRPESDRLFPWLPTFTDPAELGPILRRLVDDDGLRHQMSVRGREAVAGRTFTTHASRLLERLDRKDAA